jgi:phage shock protein A
MSDIGQELETAIRRVVVAHDRLKAASPESADYQAVKLEYLEATVHHLAVLAIAQAQQYEDLSQEVDELRARVNAMRPMVH